MFNFYFFILFQPTGQPTSNGSDMNEIVYQPLNLENLSSAIDLANLSHHMVYLCHFRNRSKFFDLSLPDQNGVQVTLNKSKRPFNLTSGDQAKFEQFTMSKLQCELGIDEQLPKKIIRAGNKINCSLSLVLCDNRRLCLKDRF